MPWVYTWCHSFNTQCHTFNTWCHTFNTQCHSYYDISRHLLAHIHTHNNPCNSSAYKSTAIHLHPLAHNSVPANISMPTHSCSFSTHCFTLQLVLTCPPHPPCSLTFALLTLPCPSPCPLTHSINPAHTHGCSDANWNAPTTSQHLHSLHHSCQPTHLLHSLTHTCHHILPHGHPHIGCHHALPCCTHCTCTTSPCVHTLQPHEGTV